METNVANIKFLVNYLFEKGILYYENGVLKEYKGKRTEARLKESI